MAAHSHIDGVIEPYQARRAEPFTVTALPQFLEEFKITPDAARALVVKETTTRTVNVQHLFGLMASAQAAGIYTGLVIILRCPFEAYLSQIEASRAFWKEKKLVEHSAAGFNTFAGVARKGLLEVVIRARRQHVRIVSYERFCAAPAAELARLMALIPYRWEPQQLAPRSGPAERRGGDPKTYEKGNQIAQTDRTAEVMKLIEELRGQPGLPFFAALRRLALEDACHLPDSTTLERLTELVLLGGR
jgi:hypothetical protein